MGTEKPCLGFARHNVSTLGLVVKNDGKFSLSPYDMGVFDCLTGERLSMGAEYPIGSTIDHLYRMSLWVGGVQGKDTLVSTGSNRWVGWAWGGEEFQPLEGADGQIRMRSVLDPEEAVAKLAVSEEDFFTMYSDTAVKHVNDYPFGYPVRPLELEITQESYAWSYGYAGGLI
ncbi:MAG: hypothetical protein P1R58_06560, partial [bacterium]|nr:hypothetical protein [bacterium]